MTRNVSAKITAPELFAGQTDDAILTRRLADCHVHVTPPVPLKKNAALVLYVLMILNNAPQNAV